jgi:RNA polymerase sigma-70 factor, ECF subfamily
MDDLQQFEALMRAYQDMVYGTAIRLLGNEAEAQDICQEVFVKAYERFHEIRESPTVGGWLKTVARNLSLNHLTRHRARWTSFTDLAREGDDSADPAAQLAAPDTQSERWDAEARSEWVERGLQQLPDVHRVPLVLYHFEELSYEAIAERLAISVSKVKTDIHRGRQALRRHLIRGGIQLGDASRPH